MADRNAISDARITASTVYDTRFYPYYGRLHENRGYGGWCPRTVIDRTDYLQVDVGAMLSVCAVATQGEMINNEWTTNYKLQLSADGVTWNAYEETSTAKVWSATVIDDYRTIKSPIQWVTKATFKIPPLQECDLLLFTSTITDRMVGQKVLWAICQNHCQVEETK